MKRDLVALVFIVSGVLMLAFAGSEMTAGIAEGIDKVAGVLEFGGSGGDK